MAGAISCGRVDADRSRSAEDQRAQSAILAYSTASQQANGLHGDVIDAFHRANRAASLPDYRDAMAREVLPSMDRFIDRLRAMPTGSPELERIHGALLAAYSEARGDLALFVQGLQTAADLRRFDPIRERLQKRIAAYRDDLEAYYRAHNRTLRLDSADGDAPAAVPATAPRAAPAAGAGAARGEPAVAPSAPAAAPSAPAVAATVTGAP